MEREEVLGNILDRLERIEEILNGDSTRLLTAEEAADYLHITLKSLYGLSHKKKVPHYKPFGKNLYFDRKDLDQLLRHKFIEAEAS